MPAKRRARRLTRGGDTASSASQGLGFLDQQSNTLQQRAAASPAPLQAPAAPAPVPTSGGGSDWRGTQLSLGPINSTNITFPKEFTDQDIPSFGQIIDDSMTQAKAYNNPMGGVSAHDPPSLTHVSDHYAPVSTGGAKKRAKKSKSAIPANLRKIVSAFSLKNIKASSKKLLNKVSGKPRRKPAAKKSAKKKPSRKPSKKPSRKPSKKPSKKPRRK